MLLRYILGIDVGGTFTDVFCLDRESLVFEEEARTMRIAAFEQAIEANPIAERRGE